MKKIHQFVLTLLIFVSLNHAPLVAMKEAPKKLSISHASSFFCNPTRYRIEDYSSMQDNRFFGVFDGHNGDAVAKFMAKNLWKEISDTYRQNPDIHQAIETSINELDPKTVMMPGGSTAVFGILHDENLFTIANVGDSRAVVCRNGKVDFITREHRACDPDEQERIVAAGCEKIMIGADQTLPEGTHSWDNDQAIELTRTMVRASNYDFLFLYRIRPSFIAGQPLYYSWRLGDLAASRSLGDYKFNMQDEEVRKPKGLIATPDIITLKLDPSYEFVIFASDGLWDIMTNEEVVEFVRTGIESKNSLDIIATELVHRARIKTKVVTTRLDDITVVVVRFTWLD